MNLPDHDQNRALCRAIADRIAQTGPAAMRIMEVCGTHTVSIFRSGIRALLPESISLVSGPGCPVCVTDQKEIDAFIELAKRENTIIATFGDLLRVPGSHASLQQEKAAGHDIRVVYSAMDALEMARANPHKDVILPGIGFETTAPTIAASILAAQQEGIDNFSVCCAHKRVPPALAALAQDPDIRIDGFLLPGHVSVVIGVIGYAPFFNQCGLPMVIAGFEPAEILTAILRLAEMAAGGRPALENAYPRAVAHNGNATARRIMAQVFDECDARWRGLGRIAKSGLVIRDAFAHFDAARRFGIDIPESAPPLGCACGHILTGKTTPPECPLYKRVCNPANPVGPCMVSSEGTCAAYYHYAGADSR